MVRLAKGTATFNGGLESHLPTGRYNPHINESYGPDSRLSKFYVTRYGETNSKAVSSSWQPRSTWRDKGTGYASNIRPQIYYTRELDNLDNPYMGAVCAGNYHSITDKSFRPYSAPDGSEAMPYELRGEKGTGFTREKRPTIPIDREVQNVHFDTRMKNLSTNYLSRHKAYLKSLEPKDPVELENANWGPAYMKSEAKSKLTNPVNPEYDRYHLTVGRIEHTGHTSNNPNVDPVQHRKYFAYRNDLPYYITNRPTGVTNYKTDYNPLELRFGVDPLPAIATRSDRNTGNTRENFDIEPPFIKSSIKLYSDLPDGKKETEYKGNYKGDQWPHPNLADRLNKRAVGPPEAMGSVQNNHPYQFSLDDPRRFITHYMTRFTDRTPVGRDREGYLCGGVSRPWSDGFTKSEGIHIPQTGPTSTDILRSMEPYQARSLRARDQFFDDHTHDGKLIENQPMKLACQLAAS